MRPLSLSWAIRCHKRVKKLWWMRCSGTNNSRVEDAEAKALVVEKASARPKEKKEKESVRTIIMGAVGMIIVTMGDAGMKATIITMNMKDAVTTTTIIIMSTKDAVDTTMERRNNSISTRAGAAEDTTINTD